MCHPAWGHALAAAQRLRDDDPAGRDPGEAESHGPVTGGDPGTRADADGFARASPARTR